MADVIWNKQAELEWRKKLIYYYQESSDIVRIADVWDTRREPSRLARRIK